MEINYSGLIALVIFLIALVFFLRHEALSEDETEEVEEVTSKQEYAASNPLDVNDEDALVACLIASIECRNETNKNVQVLGVRKVN